MYFIKQFLNSACNYVLGKTSHLLNHNAYNYSVLDFININTNEHLVSKVFQMYPFLQHLQMA